MGEALLLRPRSLNHGLHFGVVILHRSFDGNESYDLDKLSVCVFAHHESVDVDLASSSRVVRDNLWGENVVYWFATPGVVHDLGATLVAIILVVAAQSRSDDEVDQPNLDSGHIVRDFEFHPHLVVLPWPNGLGIFCLQEVGHEMFLVSPEELIPGARSLWKKDNISTFVHARFFLSFFGVEVTVESTKKSLLCQEKLWSMIEKN